MAVSDPAPDYALGSTDAEHDRLVRQAARFELLTERLFRDAGIGTGQRVLDLGSGVGDVAMLAARLVGPSGEVVGIERDPRAIARARARVAEFGLPNVTFVQSDVSDVLPGAPFDAAVGRFILMYLPQPADALRSLSRRVRPGGVLAFEEPSWVPVLALYAGLPLWSACAGLIVEGFRRTGANVDIGTALGAIFEEAGLGTPGLRMDVVIGRDTDFSRGIYDLLCSLQPRIERFGLELGKLGDIATLPERLDAELTASRGVATWLGAIVGAWARRPPSLPT